MTARVYDIYNLNSPFVTPTATTVAAQPAAVAVAATRNSDKLMRGSAYLLTFAGALLLLALVVASTPLNTIDADVTPPFVAACVGALGLIAWRVLR